MFETELKISRIGFPAFSARGCQQILMPIVTGELRRSINGKLLYLGQDSHHKFKTVITCDDKAPLAFEQVWIGADLEVSCIQRLGQEATLGDAPIHLLRPPVETTIVVTTGAQEPLPFQKITASTLTIQAPKGSKAYISFCPQLKMRVTHFRFDTHEWAGKGGWCLELEEI